jgi:hypothetical protein
MLLREVIIIIIIHNKTCQIGCERIPRRRFSVRSTLFTEYFLEFIDGTCSPICLKKIYAKMVRDWERGYDKEIILELRGGKRVSVFPSILQRLVM